MTRNRMKKIALFIDAGNLWSSYKEIGKVLDFNKFEEFFSKRFDGEIFKIFYYVAYPEKGKRSKGEIDNCHKFFTYLKKGLNFQVVKKPLKTIFLRDSDGELVYGKDTGEPKSMEKGNFDVEIAIDVIRYSSAYDIAIFFTGDSDFLPLITYLKCMGKNGKKVYIFSTDGSVSKELRTGADGYYNIENFSDIHGADLVNKK